LAGDSHHMLTAKRNVKLFTRHLKVMPGNWPTTFSCPAIWAVTCVIKTNPSEHFSVMSMISTMFSLDAYEKLIRLGRGSRAAGG